MSSGLLRPQAGEGFFSGLELNSAGRGLSRTELANPWADLITVMHLHWTVLMSGVEWQSGESGLFPVGW